MAKENFEIIAESVTSCLKSYQGKKFTIDDVMSALEIVVSSIATHKSDHVEARHNLRVFYAHTNDLVDKLYSDKDTNQKT